MTESAAQHLPYAPPSNVVEVVKRFRDRGLTEPVTRTTLEQVGVSAGNAPRTLAALRFLGLVDEGGHVTDAFKRLRQATTPEYPAALAEILRNAYRPIFNIVDPAEDEMYQIEDAFRGFEPAGQRGRMVTLFLGLCHEAGLVGEDKAPKVQPSPSRRQTSGTRSVNQQGQRSRPTSRKPAVETPPPAEQPRREAANESTPYPVVSAVVAQLPKGGSWTKKRRDLWVQAMTSAVDLAVEVEEPDPVYDVEMMPDHPELE